MQQKWLIKLSGTKYVIVESNKKPVQPSYLNVIPLPNEMESEDERWLQIEQIDIDGVMTDVVTVNETLKTTIQQQDLDNDLAKQAEQQAKDDEKNAIKDKADNTKDRKIDNFVDLKNEIQNIYDVLDYIMERI